MHIDVIAPEFSWKLEWSKEEVASCSLSGSSWSSSRRAKAICNWRLFIFVLFHSQIQHGPFHFILPRFILTKISLSPCSFDDIAAAHTAICQEHAKISMFVTVHVVDLAFNPELCAKNEGILSGKKTIFIRAWDTSSIIILLIASHKKHLLLLNRFIHLHLAILHFVFSIDNAP